ncbi:MAG: response regulator [Bacteroidales bacterium]|nr:response regulator [Bacteroidales bacterium]
MTTKSKLLIVDDEPVGRQLLEAIFLSDNYQLDFADNGKNALHYIENNTPDIVLMDVMMPEMDGFEVCKKMRDNDTLKGIPIILITALDDRDSRKRGLEAGANDYISKPFDRIEIETKVKNLLQLGIGEIVSSKPGIITREIDEKDEVFYLTNLILEAQRPLKNQIQQSLGDFFHITGTSGSSEKSFFWLAGCKNKSFILYIQSKAAKVQDTLLKILISAFLNRTIQSGQYADAADMVRQLNNFLSEKLMHAETTSLKNPEVNLSLSILDKDSGHLQLSGFNQDIMLFTGTEFKHITLNQIDHFPDIKHRFNPASYTCSPKAVIYIFNGKLSEILTRHHYFENNCLSFSKLLPEETKNNMKKQEVLFRELIKNTLQSSEITDDIEMIGLKIL